MYNTIVPCLSNKRWKFRFGSIIVDHEIFANGSQQSLKLNVTNSMIKILQQRETITLFNHSTTVKNVDVYENGSKTST